MKTETGKANAWNRMVKALLNAETQWKAYNEDKGKVEMIHTTPTIRRAMGAYARASNFMWFMEGFMRYAQTVGGLKNLIIEVKKEKKENEDAKS